MARRCECGITIDGDLSREPINLGRTCVEGNQKSESITWALRVAIKIHLLPLSVRVQGTQIQLCRVLQSVWCAMHLLIHLYAWCLIPCTGHGTLGNHDVSTDRGFCCNCARVSQQTLFMCAVLSLVYWYTVLGLADILRV
jgi:hypothetical protein